MPVVNLTESRIRDLDLGSGIWRDEQVKGLMVIAHRSTKTYAVQGDVRRNGRHVRTVRVKIDRVDRIGLREARRRAKELMSQIQSGVDPTSRPHETGITLKLALEAHLRERPFRPSTEESYRYNVDHPLLKFRGRAIADITRAEVRDLYEELKSKRGKTSAGGAMRVLRALINTAMRIDETILANPCAALRIAAPPVRQVGHARYIRLVGGHREALAHAQGPSSRDATDRSQTHLHPYRATGGCGLGAQGVDFSAHEDRTADDLSNGHPIDRDVAEAFDR